MDAGGGAPRGRATRWAVSAVFGANGLLIASLAVRTPSLKGDLGLDAGQLGLVTALFGLTAVAAMQKAGALAARLGSGTIIRAATLALPVVLVGIAVVPGFVGLIALQMVFGAVHGLLDVSMNAHAVAVERTLRQRVMNRCHGAWSIGSVIGALLGSAAAQAGMSRAAHYGLLAVVLVPLMFLTGRHLLPTRFDRDAAQEQSRPTWRSGWTRQLLVLGVMGAAVLTVEAAAANWSGVFLHDDKQASLGLASLGYVAFTGCETSLRLVGDRLQARVSATRLLCWGSLVAAAGMGIVVLSGRAWLGVAGFGIAGLGLATSLPVLFGVVGHLGAERSEVADTGAAAMVARFSTMTYTGILLAPAVIGWVAEGVGLTVTLALLIPLLLGVAGAARTVDRTGPRGGAGAARATTRATVSAS